MSNETEATNPKGVPLLKCIICNADIFPDEFRYICVQCTDYCICKECETGGEHGLHYMLRVPGPKSTEEVEALIKVIGEHLLKEESTRLAQENEPSPSQDGSSILGEEPSIAGDEPSLTGDESSLLEEPGPALAASRTEECDSAATEGTSGTKDDNAENPSGSLLETASPSLPESGSDSVTLPESHEELASDMSPDQSSAIAQLPDTSQASTASSDIKTESDLSSDASETPDEKVEENIEIPENRKRKLSSPKNESIPEMKILQSLLQNRNEGYLGYGLKKPQPKKNPDEDDSNVAGSSKDDKEDSSSNQ